MSALEEIRFRHGEQDRARVPKLNQLLEHLIGLGEVTLDDALEALNALTASANKIAYFTGPTTAALADLTAFARTILDDADAGTVRTTIGAQAGDATLTALAALNWTAGSQIPVFTAADTVSFLTVGATGSTNILDRAAGDARYQLQSTFAESVDDRIATLLQQGTNISLSYNDAGDQLTIAISDAQLNAIAALTPAADQLIYWTGVSAAAMTALSAFGRSLIDDADAAAARTTLGLVIGTDVQAYDPDLATWVGITPGAGVGAGLAAAALGSGGVVLGTEGTFTPLLKFAGLSTGMTYTTQDGVWRRHGNLIIVQMDIELSAKGSSTGVASLRGLPVTIPAARRVAAMLTCNYLTPGVVDPRALGLPGLNQMNLYRFDSATGLLAPLQDFDFTDTTWLVVTLIYAL